MGGGHTVQYTHHVSQKCTLETYIILLTSVASINLIFFKLAESGLKWLWGNRTVVGRVVRVSMLYVL